MPDATRQSSDPSSPRAMTPRLLSRLQRPNSTLQLLPHTSPPAHSPQRPLQTSVSLPGPITAVSHRNRCTGRRQIQCFRSRIQSVGSSSRHRARWWRCQPGQALAHHRYATTGGFRRVPCVHSRPVRQKEPTRELNKACIRYQFPVVTAGFCCAVRRWCEWVCHSQTNSACECAASWSTHTGHENGVSSFRVGGTFMALSGS